MGPINRPNLSDMVTILRSAATRLHDLLERGHRLCQLRAGLVTSRVDRFDIAAVWREAISEQSEKARESDLKFSFGGVASAWLESDENKVREIAGLVTEFLAIRAPRSGSVRTDLEIDNGSPVLSCRATMDGLEAATVALFLEPYRVADVNHHSGEGLLNLPLAAELIRHLQGTVTASMDPDGDLDIRIRFPEKVDISLLGLSVSDSDNAFDAAA